MDRRIPSPSAPSPPHDSSDEQTSNALNELAHELSPNQTLPTFSQAQPSSGSATPQADASSGSNSTTGLNAGAGLNEFRSLLEAAQRIANGATVDPDQGPWPQGETNDPAARRLADPTRRLRQPLIRQYSGRPHVPGEDSGSEDGDPSRQEQEHSTPQTVRRSRNTSIMSGDTSPNQQNRSPFRNSTAAPLDASAESEQDVERARQREAAFRAGMRASARYRASRDISQERHRRRAEIITRFHERLHAQDRPEPDENASTTADHISLTHDEFYDWGPEPEALHPSANTADSTRSHLSYLRRWRPSERLQDFASSHARRDSLTGNQSQALPPLEIITPDRWRQRTSTTHDLSDHNDIVDRVERALQEYRLARRAFRSQQEENQSSANASSARRPLDGSGLVHRPTEVSPTIRNALLARHARDSIRDADDSQLETRRPDRDRISTLSALADRSAEASRARIREQARERRRRIVGGIADQENGTSFASGPLFDRSEDRPLSHEHERTRTETRTMLDKVRRAEARAKSKDLQRAKAALQHLVRLREPNMTSVKAWTSAAESGLHNQSLTEAEKKNLPMSLKDLPLPAYSSWLEPGMTWEGTQAADESDFQTSRRISYTSTTPSRTLEEHYTDLVARSTEITRANLREYLSSEPIERVLLGSQGRSSASDTVESATRNSMQALEEAERNLANMLERNRRLLRENERQLQENQERLTRDRERLRVHNEAMAVMTRGSDPVSISSPLTSRLQGDRSNGSTAATHHSKPRDHWNVKVSLHEVDWEKMTINGTMTATSATNEVLQLSNPNRPADLTCSASTQSFFTGEIIDFTTYGLDTIAPSPETSRIFHSCSSDSSNSQNEFRVGGPDVDLTYWSKLGPFKQAIDEAERAHELELQEAIRKQELEKLLPDTPRADPSTPSTSTENKSDATNDDDSPSLTPTAAAYHTTDEKLNRQMRTMHNILTDSAWVRENINAKGWVLMRWKERCFVSPDGEPNPEPSRPYVPTRSAMGTTSTGNDSALARGWSSFTDFYQRRQNERVANASVVFTTNAAEREEQARRGGSWQTMREVGGGGVNGQTPTWGLTISGFYYVAMHRGSGRIEALYYDCRSAPFQRLSMEVATDARGKKLKEGKESREWIEIEGVRDNFSIVQFR